MASEVSCGRAKVSGTTSTLGKYESKGKRPSLTTKVISTGRSCQLRENVQ
jgi:hypothetical protein